MLCGSGAPDSVLWRSGWGHIPLNKYLMLGVLCVVISASVGGAEPQETEAPFSQSELGDSSLHPYFKKEVPIGSQYFKTPAPGRALLAITLKLGLEKEPDHS